MKRNNIIFGVVIGLVMPILAHLLTMHTSWNMALGGKALSLYVIAALANLMLVRYYYRKELENTAKGIVLVTFLAAILLIFTQNLKV